MELPEPIKQEEPVSTFYHNPPTGPFILSPYVEVIDTKQKQIDDLQQQLSQLANQFQAYITAVHGTNGSN